MEAFPNVRFISYFDTRLGFELVFQCHMFEVHLTLRYKVMFILLKSGITASRDDDVEDVKECRLTPRPWCPSTLMLDDGLSLFQDQLRSRNHHKLPEFPQMTQDHIYVCFYVIVQDTLYSIVFFRFPLRFGEKINYL